MKTMKKLAAAALLGAILLTLCGCQSTPETGAVISKNDGAFEAALEGEGTAPAPAAETTPAPKMYEDTFTGAAENIRFHVAVAEPDRPAALPVLQVRPRELTPELAESIARAMFGDADIYEYTSQFSKAEIEQAILDVKQALFDWEGRVASEGVDQEDQDLIRADYNDRIARLEAEYETAPETVEQELCRWEYYPENHYRTGADASIREDNGHRTIQCLAQVDGTTYKYEAMSRLGEDYKVQRISVGGDDRGITTDADIAAAQQAAQQERAEAAEADMDAVRARALELVRSLDIGQWAVASDEAVTGSDYAEPSDLVILTPVYNGVPLTFHSGGFNPKSSDAYATTYGYEYIKFDVSELSDESAFGFDGFTYECMHQVVGTVNENVETLPFDRILEIAEAQMKMMGEDKLLMGSEGIGSVMAEVTKVELGLSRIRMKDNATDYYLTPTYTFYVTTTACDETGQPYVFPVYDDAGNETGEQTTYTVTREAAVINAVDGSVIDTRLGY